MLKEREIRTELNSLFERKYGMNNEERTILRNQVYYCELRSDSSSSVQGNIRPVVILSNNLANHHSPVILIAPLTSKSKKRTLPVHVILSCEKYRFLKSDSIILLEQIMVIDKARLGDFVGTISGEDIERTNKAIEISLDLVEKMDKINKQINNNQNVIDIKVVRIATEISEELRELDTTIKILSARNINIKMIENIFQERQDKIAELERLCKQNNLNINNYYQDYNKSALQKAKAKMK